ncbi:eye-specific diacylglycerol kinase-like isoform X5 [Rhopalosiphum padi]|uniref:eye-specific diacylglycerol kinase-like isoform X5 n=1 Tax=Rhopalosiphum padi TaxID=40932 RepID=UPI00298DEBBC|nr:eye-specific diacylglycerol kinase-like isoform X5 [Rhopalosiphum padi]
MDRLRSTFKRSRTPTGAEMKTQNSLEVPKQVRSVSFDEIKLGCTKRDEDARKERSSGSVGGGHAAAASSLRVPAGGGSGQRSRSFDSSAAAASTSSGDRDDPGVYLEVPSSKHQLFHRRRSSGEKVPAAASCVHCAYLEELSKMNRSSSGEENHSQRSLASTSASEDMEDEDDRGCQITVTVDTDLQDDPAAAASAIRLLSVADGRAGDASSPSRDLEEACVKNQLTLELTPPDEYLQGNRRRSITSPKLERQEAFVVSDPADPAAVRDLFLTVPDLKRDRAASMDSCFINKPTPAGKPEEVVPVSPTQLLLDPNCGQPACNNIRSRSVDIVLPTDQQARYKALSTNNQTSSPPSAVPAHRVPPDKGATGTDGNDKLLKIVPDWTEEAANDDHLWSVTSHNVDFCYIGESECSKHGVRLKCSGCRIIVHSECLGNLPEAAKCKSSFKDDGVRQYREHKTVKHHWMHRRTQKDKCSQCGKAFQSVLSFSSKEIIALTCSWCKLSVHNKTACFNDTKMNEPCSLGKHSNIIVPPSWIVKLPRKGNFKSSIRSPKKRSSKKKTKDKPDKEDKLFVIKPIPTVNVKPVIIFINPKSGGNQGVKLLQKFQWHLNPRQVFDLSRGGPRMGLELYKKVPNLRVLACGGDGTVGWVLSILDQIANAVSFPVGVLPLGTGNDLARALGWGGGYMDEPVSKILTNLEESETIRLDRWNLEVVPNEHVKGTDHAGKDNLPLNVMNNYFSLGVDAQIALEFHEAREANPEKFSSRMYNKLFYGVRGGIELLDRKWKGLSDHVTLECDGKDLTQRIKDLKVHAILFLNIPSYGGGTRPWNKSAGNNSTDDGLIEVIGLTIMQITRLQTGGTGTPLCQCKTARITTSIPVPMQVDGEACRLKPSVITLGFFNQATMMAKRRKGRQTPTRETTIDKHKVSVQRLRLQDYEQHHCDKELLIQSSINMGEIEVEPVADLETVRKLVDKLELNGSPSKDHAGNAMPKLSPDWCFVDCCTAERFFRIDRAQESLHYLIDITHDQLFVLDDPHRAASTEEDVTVVLKAKEPADDQGAQDTTTSHYGQVRTSDKIIEAAKTGNLNMLRNLFEMGYSLMSINKDGQTALHVASQRGDSNLVRYILANAPSNIVSIKDNQEGQTALHVAVQNGERKICYLLVSAGAPLLAVDRQDRTAQQIAEQTRDYDLAKYLECQAQFVSFADIADQTETSV